MSYLPAIPLSGYAGWAVLKRTAETQKIAFNHQASVKQQEAYFREKIGEINSAEQLVSDHRLLTVALGAYGLDADIGSKFFIRKVLEDGTLDPSALAMRLADKRYNEFSADFGLSSTSQPLTKLSGFADKIIARWKDRAFETAVGQVNGDLQLAMNAERELVKVASSEKSEDVLWFTVMGQRPLRKVFEVAFGLPLAFGALDIDRQKTILQEKARAHFGSDSLSQFKDPEKVEKLVRSFLLRSQVNEGSTGFSSASAALSLLSQRAPVARS